MVQKWCHCLVLSFSFFFTPSMNNMAPRAPSRSPPATLSLTPRSSRPLTFLPPCVTGSRCACVWRVPPPRAAERDTNRAPSHYLSLPPRCRILHTVCLPTLSCFFYSLFSISVSVSVPFPSILIPTLFSLSLSPVIVGYFPPHTPPFFRSSLPPHVSPLTQSLMLFLSYLYWPLLLFLPLSSSCSSWHFRSKPTAAGGAEGCQGGQVGNILSRAYWRVAQQQHKVKRKTKAGYLTVLREFNRCFTLLIFLYNFWSV